MGHQIWYCSVSIIYLALAGILAGVIVNRFMQRDCPHNIMLDIVVGATVSIAFGVLYGYLAEISPLQASLSRWAIGFASALMVLYLWCMIRVGTATKA